MHTNTHQHTHTHTQIPAQMRRSDIQTQPTNPHALCHNHNGASQRGSRGRWEICESKRPAPHRCLTSSHFVSLLHLSFSPSQGGSRWLGGATGSSPLLQQSCMNHLRMGWVPPLCPTSMRLFFFCPSWNLHVSHIHY